MKGKDVGAAYDALDLSDAELEPGAVAGVRELLMELGADAPAKRRRRAFDTLTTQLMDQGTRTWLAPRLFPLLASLVPAQESKLQQAMLRTFCELLVPDEDVYAWLIDRGGDWAEPFLAEHALHAELHRAATEGLEGLETWALASDEPLPESLFLLGWFSGSDEAWEGLQEHTSHKKANLRAAAHLGASVMAMRQGRAFNALIAGKRKSAIDRAGRAVARALSEATAVEDGGLVTELVGAVRDLPKKPVAHPRGSLGRAALDVLVRRSADRPEILATVFGLFDDHVPATSGLDEGIETVIGLLAGLIDGIVAPGHFRAFDNDIECEPPSSTFEPASPQTFSATAQAALQELSRRPSLIGSRLVAILRDLGIPPNAEAMQRWLAEEGASNRLADELEADGRRQSLGAWIDGIVRGEDGAAVARELAKGEVLPAVLDAVRDAHWGGASWRDDEDEDLVAERYARFDGWVLQALVAALPEERQKLEAMVSDFVEHGPMKIYGDRVGRPISLCAFVGFVALALALDGDAEPDDHALLAIARVAHRPGVSEAVREVVGRAAMEKREQWLFYASAHGTSLVLKRPAAFGMPRRQRLADASWAFVDLVPTETLVELVREEDDFREAVPEALWQLVTILEKRSKKDATQIAANVGSWLRDDLEDDDEDRALRKRWHDAGFETAS